MIDPKAVRAMQGNGILCAALCWCGKTLPLMGSPEREVTVTCADCGFHKSFGTGGKVPDRVRAHNAEVEESFAWKK